MTVCLSFWRQCGVTSWKAIMGIYCAIAGIIGWFGRPLGLTEHQLAVFGSCILVATAVLGYVSIRQMALHIDRRRTYHGALDVFTGEYHPTFTAQALDCLTGTNAGTEYEKLFNEIYSLIRGVQSLPALARGVSAVGAGLWA